MSRAAPVVPDRLVRRPPLLEPGELLGRLVDRHPGPEPPEEVGEVAGAPGRIGGIDPHRDPRLRVAIGEGEARGHDAEHAGGGAVELHRAPHDRRVGPEAALPQPVAQDHHVVMARCVLVRSEHAAQRRLDPEHREERPGAVHDVQAFGVVAAGERALRPTPETELVPRPRLRPVVLVLGPRGGERHQVHRRELRPHHGQPVRLRVGERSQEHPVHDAEDRRVRADAERQREHEHHGEARSAGELPERVLEILSEVLHDRLPPRFVPGPIRHPCRETAPSCLRPLGPRRTPYVPARRGQETRTRRGAPTGAPHLLEHPCHLVRVPTPELPRQQVQERPVDAHGAGWRHPPDATPSVARARPRTASRRRVSSSSARRPSRVSA